MTQTPSAPTSETVAAQDSATVRDGSADFDAYHGRWRLLNRRLRDVFDPDCDEWVEFGASTEVQPIFGGLGNFEFTHNEADPPFDALTVRLYDPATGLWRIWWASARVPGELGLGTVVAAAQLKMMAALPAELRDRAGRISARFHLDAPGWYRDADPVPHLAAAAAAVWEEQVIEIRYRRWKAPEEVTRTLQPYGLVLKAGRWYLAAAQPGEAGGASRVATYRVSQILDLRPVNESFERPADFDLTGYWQAYLADFESRRHRGAAVVRLSPAGRDRARHLLEPAASRAIGQTAGPPDASGWIRAVIPIESPAHAASDLLRLGADAEVLEPPELRDLMTATVEALTRTYDRAPVGDDGNRATLRKSPNDLAGPAGGTRPGAEGAP